MRPGRFPVISLKYPKLAAAIDELLAKVVSENGEGMIEFALELAMKEPILAANVKQVDIPVTKELVLSEQTEVRDGN